MDVDFITWHLESQETRQHNLMECYLFIWRLGKMSSRYDIVTSRISLLYKTISKNLVNIPGVVLKLWKYIRSTHKRTHVQVRIPRIAVGLKGNSAPGGQVSQCSVIHSVSQSVSLDVVPKHYPRFSPPACIIDLVELFLFKLILRI